jgi:acetolactate synthase I/II/III large subunit
VTDRSTVAAIVADALGRADVPRVFAAADAGGVVADAMRGRGVAVVTTAGATAACIMASVTAELGAAPGVALVSLGDGVAPVIDGAAHATRDRAAVVVVSDSQRESRLLEPVVKASVVVEAASAAHWVAHAVQAAMAHPRGAVHLAIPSSTALAPALPVAMMVRPAPAPVPPADALDALSDAIARASRPVLIAGLEIGADDAKWIRALVESLPAPVLTTPKGKGALPDPHPLAFGLLAADHPLLAQTDLLIALGVDPVELPPHVWPSGIARVAVSRSPQDDAVVGDITLVLEELAPRLRGRMQADWDVAALDRLKRMLAASGVRAGLARRRVVEIVRQATPAGTIVSLDVPLASAWQSVAPRECLIPNGVATHGFALPASIAAALAREDTRVVAIGGAAGFDAMAAEWRTVREVGVAILAVALNDAGGTDVSRAAQAAGVDVVSARDEPGFAAAFERAWRARTPTLIDARVTR